jgi:RHS repeat-associated protein
MFRADYLGYQFWTPVYGIPETSSAALAIPHRNVTVSVSEIYGTESIGLPNLKVYLFTASGAYMGKTADTDAEGHAAFILPEKDYKFRTDYLGSQFWSDAASSQDADIDIAHGKIDIHVTEYGAPVVNAPVYLFTESGAYLGKNQKTDAAGRTSFILPEKVFKFRIDYNGLKFWSDAVTPLPHSELEIQMPLELLSSKLTNDPNPIRFDGTPPERPPIMFASLGSITTLFTQSIVAQTPQKKLYFYLNDHLATPIKIIDDQNNIVWAADYKPFGEMDITVEEVENNFRFPGQYYDQESRLHYNYHRYYNQQIGRFLMADPSHAIHPLSMKIPYLTLRQSENPSELMNYPYVNNSPINLYDPMGLFSKQCETDCPGGEWSSFSLPSFSAWYGGGINIGRSYYTCKSNNKKCNALALCFGGGAIVAAGAGIDFSGYPKSQDGIKDCYNKNDLKRFGFGLYVAGGPISMTYTGSTKNIGLGKSLGAGIAFITCTNFDLRCDF